MYVVGLEVSTSSAKAILFSKGQTVVAVASQPLDSSVSQITWQDPQGIIDAALGALREIVSKADGPITAIGLGGIWHSLLLLDKENKPLTPIWTWAHIPQGDFLAKVKEDHELCNWFYQKTGCVIHGMYPIWKLADFRQKNSGLLQKTARLSSQIEYLFTGLTNQRKVSACTASGTGLFNIWTKTWDPELAEFAGVSQDMLPPIVEGDYVAPLSKEVAKDVGLPEGIPVTVGCADGALNQIASGGLQGDIMTFSVGTSGALRVATEQPLLGKDISTWCYYLFNGKRLAGAATHGGSNLTWFLDLFGYDNHSHEKLTEGAAELDILAGPLFLPFVFGERAPGWDGDRAGGFVELRASHGQSHLYKGVLEGILFALYQSFLKLKDVGATPSEIRLSGGILHSPYWSQMAADIFGQELNCTGTIHESTVGAALLGAQAIGLITNLEKDIDPPLENVIRPCAKRHKLYQRRFQRYLEHYQLGG